MSGPADPYVPPRASSAKADTRPDGRYARWLARRWGAAASVVGCVLLPFASLVSGVLVGAGLQGIQHEARVAIARWLAHGGEWMVATPQWLLGVEVAAGIALVLAFTTPVLVSKSRWPWLARVALAATAAVFVLWPNPAWARMGFAGGAVVGTIAGEALAWRSRRRAAASALAEDQPPA